MSAAPVQGKADIYHLSVSTSLRVFPDIGVEDIVTCVEWLHQAEHGVVIGTQSGTVHMQDVRQSVGPQQTTYPHVRAVTRMGFSHHR